MKREEKERMGAVQSAPQPEGTAPCEKQIFTKLTFTMSTLTLVLLLVVVLLPVIYLSTLSLF